MLARHAAKTKDEVKLDADSDFEQFWLLVFLVIFLRRLSIYVTRPTLGLLNKKKHPPHSHKKKRTPYVMQVCGIML